MRLAIVANETMKEELLSSGKTDDLTIDWVSSAGALISYPDSDAFIDLLYEQNGYNNDVLKKLLPKAVIVNSIVKTIDETGHPFIRINGWPTFLKRKTVEASCKQETDKAITEKIFTSFNRKVEWVPDVPGFISARVVSMIINEAYFAFSEKVSSKEEIDTAMKLGTNYPYGPFEWATAIGLKNINSLLTQLSNAEKRYQPSILLTKEALES